MECIRKFGRRSLLAAGAVALVFASGCGGGGDGDTGGDAAIADRGDFLLSFSTPGSGEEVSARLLEETGVMAAAVRGLNDVFALPTDVQIVFRASEAGNPYESPFYDPSTRTIEFPYGFFGVTAYLLQQMNPGMSDEDIILAAVQVTIFNLYHEVGHSMVDILNIPITGREEDAVDGLSAALLSVSPDTIEFLLAEASFWQGVAALQGGNDTVAERFSDEHSLSEQRSYQMLCWVYGSDPDRFAALVDEGYLPSDRASRCGSEAEQNMESWITLLSDYMK